MTVKELIKCFGMNTVVRFYDRKTSGEIKPASEEEFDCLCQMTVVNVIPVGYLEAEVWVW